MRAHGLLLSAAVAAAAIHNRALQRHCQAHRHRVLMIDSCRPYRLTVHPKVSDTAVALLLHSTQAVSANQVPVTISSRLRIGLGIHMAKHNTERARERLTAGSESRCLGCKERLPATKGVAGNYSTSRKQTGAFWGSTSSSEGSSAALGEHVLNHQMPLGNLHHS